MWRAALIPCLLSVVACSDNTDWLTRDKVEYRSEERGQPYRVLVPKGMKRESTGIGKRWSDPNDEHYGPYVRVEHYRDNKIMKRVFEKLIADPKLVVVEDDRKLGLWILAVKSKDEKHASVHVIRDTKPVFDTALNEQRMEALSCIAGWQLAEGKRLADIPKVLEWAEFICMSMRPPEK
jgi:hypothetical protein